ncbi:hypothetical protein VZ95_17380, partial [Elstera litoralis]
TTAFCGDLPTVLVAMLFKNTEDIELFIIKGLTIHRLAKALVEARMLHNSLGSGPSARTQDRVVHYYSPSGFRALPTS